LVTDTVATETLTSFQKQTVVEGDMVLVCATTLMQGQLKNYSFQPLKLSTGPFYLQIGVATDTQSTIYSTPFSGGFYAIGAQAEVNAIISGIYASKGVKNLGAINLINSGAV